MFENFLDVFSLTLNVEDVVERLVVGLLCGVLLALFYRRSYRNTYVPGFVASLILLTITTACVIMVIGDSLARAFGLAGAMSIIRFRTALKDTHDIVFVFIALTMGLAIGVGFYLVAITGSIFIGLTAWTLNVLSSRFQTAEIDLTEAGPGGTRLRAHGAVSRLSFSYRAPEPESEPAYVPILRRYCERFEPASVKVVGDQGKRTDVAYLVVVPAESIDPLVHALSGVKGLRNPRLVYRTTRGKGT